MPDTLEGETGFRTQLAIWGYALQGDAILETAAIIAEGGNDIIVCGGRAWDSRSPGLTRALIAHGEEPYRPIRDWGKLPWMVEHILRLGLEWPGL